MGTFLPLLMQLQGWCAQLLHGFGVELKKAASQLFANVGFDQEIICVNSILMDLMKNFQNNWFIVQFMLVLRFVG